MEGRSVTRRSFVLPTFSALAPVAGTLALTAAAYGQSAPASRTDPVIFNNSLMQSYDIWLSTNKALWLDNAGAGGGAANTFLRSDGSTITLNGNAIVTGTLQASGAAVHGLVGVQTFCVSGCTAVSGAYTPDAGTSTIIVEVQAAGGGSGGTATTAASNFAASGPGAGGSYARVLVSGGFVGAVVTAPGGGTAGTAGSNAGASGVTAAFGTLISCPGGTGGVGGASTAFVAATTINATAAPAACTISSGAALLSVAGQGAGPSIILGSAANTVVGATGGDAPLGLGGAQNASATKSVGNAGSGYGGGASSAVAIASQGATQTGSAGAPGIVIIYEYY
jgi:hypothetical protein